MKFLSGILLSLFGLSLSGQSVNEKITLQLSQASVLRVDAGSDINLSETGSVTIGDLVTITGGTPEYAYEWYDEIGHIYYEKSPEVQNSGMYWLTVTDENNCLAIDSLTLFDYGTTVKRFSREDSEYVIRDQGNNSFQILIRNVNGPVSLSVISIDGKILYSFSNPEVKGDFTHRVDLPHTASNYCLLSIQYNNRVSVKKLILN